MNSALSYLYTVLLGECVGALVACGAGPGDRLLARGVDGDAVARTRLG